MRITDATKHARFQVLVDKVLNYPREADSRGARCPPAPFGRTETYVKPLDLDGDSFPTIEISTSVSNTVASSNRLTALERAEYATLIVGAQVGAQAKENT